MTTPGSEGTGYVDIVARLSTTSVEKLEKDLARAAKRAGKNAGDIAGAEMAKSLQRAFTRTTKVLEPRYFAAGAAAGRATRRGFSGEKYGRLSAQDFLRGVRRGLNKDSIGGGGGKKLRDQLFGGATGVSAGQKLIDQANAERERGAAKLQRDLAKLEQDGARRRVAIDRIAEASIARTRSTFARAAAREADRLANDAARGAGGGRNNLRGGGFGLPNIGKLFSQSGAIQAGLALSPALVPGLASLFQALRNASGALFGIFPLVTTVIGLFTLFGGKNAKLAATFKPLVDGFHAVQRGLDSLVATAAKPGVSLFKKQFDQLTPSLARFAVDFGTSIANIAKALNNVGAGSRIGGALTSIGQAFVGLTSSPGVQAFLDFLLKINTQVSATLPGLFNRLGNFLGSLSTRFGKVDFGKVFERGVQAVVDFGGAVVNLGRALNAFFNDVSGRRPQGTFFATLRADLARLTAFFNEPGTQAGITRFFNGVRTLGSAIAQSLPAIGALVQTFIPLIPVLGSATKGLLQAFTALVSVLKATHLLVPVLFSLAVGFAASKLLTFASGLKKVAAGLIEVAAAEAATGGGGTGLFGRLRGARLTRGGAAAVGLVGLGLTAGADNTTTRGKVQGIAGGALTGAAIGSVIPGIGTLAGAVGGAVVAGVIAGFRSGAQRAAKDKQALKDLTTSLQQAIAAGTLGTKDLAGFVNPDVKKNALAALNTTKNPFVATQRTDPRAAALQSAAFDAAQGKLKTFISTLDISKFHTQAFQNSLTALANSSDPKLKAMADEIKALGVAFDDPIVQANTFADRVRTRVTLALAGVAPAVQRGLAQFPKAAQAAAIQVSAIGDAASQLASKGKAGVAVFNSILDSTGLHFQHIKDLATVNLDAISQAIYEAALNAALHPIIVSIQQRTEIPLPGGEPRPKNSPDTSGTPSVIKLPPIKVPKIPNVADPTKAAAAAKAVKQAVDLTTLLEEVTTRLHDALRAGGAETSKTFLDLRKSIKSALSGTLQEGKTKAVLAFLASQRSGAIAAANSYAQISRAVDVTTAHLKALKDEQDQFRQSVLDTLKATASISTFLAARPGGGVASFLRFQAKDIAKLTQFQANLATVLRKGLDPALVRELASGGLDNARFAKKLAAATPDQIRLINANQAKINRLAAGTANLTAATFDAGIKKVADLLTLQLTQQKRQEIQLNRLALGIVNGIAAIIKGKPIPKFAHGGVATRPSIFGDAGPELAVPLLASQRSREVEQLLAALARASGTPSAPTGRVVNGDLVFNLPPTKADPRAIARAVDKRLAEAVR